MVLGVSLSLVTTFKDDAGVAQLLVIDGHFDLDVGLDVDRDDLLKDVAH